MITITVTIQTVNERMRIAALTHSEKASEPEEIIASAVKTKISEAIKRISELAKDPIIVTGDNPQAVENTMRMALEARNARQKNQNRNQL